MLSSSGNPEINAILDETDRAMADKTISLSATIAALARKAAARMGELIVSGNEHVALKASSDILDRTPETSKNLKVTNTNWNLDSADAKELAAALVQGARVKETYAEIAAGDFVRVELEAEPNGKEAEGQALRQVDNGDAGDSKGDSLQAQRPDELAPRGLPPAEGNGSEGT